MRLVTVLKAFEYVAYFFRIVIGLVVTSMRRLRVLSLEGPIAVSCADSAASIVTAGI